MRTAFHAALGWLIKVLELLRENVQASGRVDDPSFQPRRLGPEYEQAKHREYVDLLEASLSETDPARSVAVSGPYGSGKSSVLAGLVRRLRSDRVVVVALGAMDDTVTLNSNRRGRNAQSEDALAGADDVTNALQKEIVKRLLYSASASRLPRSQLNRIRPFGPRRAIAIGVLTAFVGLSARWAYELPGPFARLLGALPTLIHWEPGLDAAFLGRLADFVLLAGVVVFLLWVASQVRLKEVAVGEFKLSRDDPTQDYSSTNTSMRSCTSSRARTCG